MSQQWLKGTATLRTSRIFHELDYHQHYFPSNDPGAHETDLARCNLTRARGHINPNEHESWQLRCPKRMTSEDSAPHMRVSAPSWWILPAPPPHVTSWHVPPGLTMVRTNIGHALRILSDIIPDTPDKSAAACRSNYSNPNWSINLINIYICIYLRQYIRIYVYE